MSPVRLVPDELIEHAAICCDARVRKWPRLRENAKAINRDRISSSLKALFWRPHRKRIFCN
jgi:hypothetical protein